MKRKMAKEQIELAIAMVKQGMSENAVAEYYGVSRQYLHAYCVGRGINSKHGRTKVELEDQSKIHNFVNRAIAQGVLIPEPCEVCGIYGKDDNGKRKVIAHHDDYNQPLQVRWLCHLHHGEWHKNNDPIRCNQQIDKIIDNAPRLSNRKPYNTLKNLRKEFKTNNIDVT